MILYVFGSQPPSQNLFGVPLPLATALLGGLFALAGVLVGTLISGKRQERARKLEWLEKQLREFYGPLWGMRCELAALKEYESEVGRAMSTLGQQKVDQHFQSPSMMLGDTVEKIMAPYTTDIEYNNTQLFERILPLYRKMQEMFRNRLHLADPQTVEHFAALVKFNDCWDRSRKSGIPFDVAMKVRFSESNLHAFYEHLRERVETLRSSVKTGKPC